MLVVDLECYASAKDIERTVVNNTFKICSNIYTSFFQYALTLLPKVSGVTLYNASQLAFFFFAKFYDSL